MQVNFIESSPDPGEGAMAAMGLLEEVTGCRWCRRRDASRARDPGRAGDDWACLAQNGGSMTALADGNRRSLVAAGASGGRRTRARQVFAQLRAALSAGEARAAEPDASTPTGWRVNTWVKQGILLGFRFGDIVDMSADHGTLAVLRQGHAAAQAARPPRAACASCPADRRSATARTSAPASSACRRCTSTSAPTSATARWSTRTRWSDRARRSARACTSAPRRRSAACSSRSARCR